MDDRRIGDSPHDLLLALAGWVDDDLLAWCRELVAVGEDGRAVALACAALAADRAALPPAVRHALVDAARVARTDLDADAALPPAAGHGAVHRFDAALPVVGTLAAAVAGLPARQVAGCRLHATARTTPAGAAPGPLPQPVVVAEVDAADPRPADVLAYQLAIACARAGVPAAVEVVVEGAALLPYQEAALRASRAVDADGPAPEAAPRSSLADRMAAWDALDVGQPAAGTPADPLPGPTATESTATDPTPADPAPAPAAPAGAVSPGPAASGDEQDLEAAPVHEVSSPEDDASGNGSRPADVPVPERPDPERPDPERPDPAPFGRPSTAPVSFEPATPAPDDRAEAVAPEDRPVWPATGSLVLPRRRPSPGSADDPPQAPSEPVRRPTALRPLPRRAPDTNGRPRPSADEPREADVRPLRPAPTDTPALASLVDPLSDPLSDPLPRPADPGPAIDEADPLGLGPMPLSPEEPREPVADSWLSDWLTGDWAMPPAPAADEVRPAPEPAPDEPGFVLRPETAARLNDDDRELLARLQAELGSGPRPRVTRRAGIASNGRAPRPAPPDIAG